MAILPPDFVNGVAYYAIFRPCNYSFSRGRGGVDFDKQTFYKGLGKRFRVIYRGINI